MSALNHPDQHDAQHETTDADLESLTRLHISPFTPELYQTLISRNSQESARGISFHQIRTFPESAYGYINLPEKEAQKLKRLNGAVLKGKKLHIANARAEKWRSVEEMDTDSRDSCRRSSTKRSKAKISYGDNIITGFELPKDRHVKRGWAATATRKRTNTGKSKDDATKSEDVGKSEILFRASFPPNKLPIKSKSKDLDQKHKKLRAKVVVGKSNDHKRLQSKKSISDKGTVSQYIDGHGWVNEDGELVETHVTKKKKIKGSSLSPSQDHISKGEGVVNDAKEPSASPEDFVALIDETVSLQVSNLSAEDGANEETPMHILIPSNNENKSVGRRSSLANKNSDKNQRQRQVSFALCEEDLTAQVHTIGEEPTIDTEEDVHPLERIFKPSKSTDKGPKLAPIRTSFSFFEDNNVDNKQGHEPPQTPFTIQDRHLRRIRSPAPTPDTAAINRKASWPWAKGVAEADVNVKAEEETAKNDDEHDDEIENEEAQAQASDSLGRETERVVGQAKKDKTESDFAKWFWENRGENNRAWRRRRREAMKIERQRQNKRLAKRV